MRKSSYLTLDDEFVKYCEINGIKDSNELAKQTFNRGFTLLKFGETPVSSGERITTKEVIVEVIKEVIKEVPVEVIKEVIKEVQVPIEIVKEVPIEVIKEVPVEIKADTIIQEVIKEVVVVNDSEIKRLNEEIIKLKKDLEGTNNLIEENKKLKDDLDKITSALNGMSKGKFMKNSNMNSLYGE